MQGVSLHSAPAQPSTFMIQPSRLPNTCTHHGERHGGHSGRLVPHHALLQHHRGGACLADVALARVVQGHKMRGGLHARKHAHTLTRSAHHAHRTQELPWLMVLGPLGHAACPLLPRSAPRTHALPALRHERTQHLLARSVNIQTPASPCSLPSTPTPHKQAHALTCRCW